jgi:TusE/DsrC/DsvC family sulfur relay protein
MPTIEYEGMTIEVDDEGYLIKSEDWNETVARALAQREGLFTLTEEMVDILLFMREYYKKYDSFPVLSAVCKNVHQPRECVYEQIIDPIKAWRIAGLPKPTTEVFSLLRHEM